MSLTITLLGTGNPIPDALRAGPSTLVAGTGTTVLVDCGRGVVQRLVAAGVFPPMLDAVLVTHLHSDHITDLNDVITTHWVMTMQPTPLRIYGPPGIGAVVDAILASLAPDIGYRLAHHEDLTWEPLLEITEVEGRIVFETVWVPPAGPTGRRQLTCLTPVRAPPLTASSVSYEIAGFGFSGLIPSAAMAS